jgi:hypothetical protein
MNAMARLTAVVIAAGALFALLPGVALAATQDAVTGAGSFESPDGTFAVDAVSEPSGDNAGGTVEFELAIGTMLARLGILSEC